MPGDTASTDLRAYNDAMEKKHLYRLTVTWTGNTGSGTSSYRSYERSYEVSQQGKIGASHALEGTISGSSDVAFRGDRSRWNPEELLVAALSSCHLLSYLHLCADAGITALGYVDEAQGEMEQTADGGGKFVHVILRPRVTVSPGSDIDRATLLHHAAHENCFIANSVNFAVDCEPLVTA